MPTALPVVTGRDSRGRVEALDAIRGVAILCVVATHSLSATVAATGSYSFPPEVFRFFDYGQFGVQLFFLLSGWLMFSLYTGGRPWSQRVYWSRRWARIWPLWLIFLAVFYVVDGVPDAGMPGWLGFLLGAVFLGWLSPVLVFIPTGGLTIQQEMGHYLLFSWFRRRSVAFLAGTVIVGVLSMVAARGIVGIVGSDSLIGEAMEAWLRFALFTSWPFFLLGGAAYAALELWRKEGLVALVPERSWTAVLVAVALLMTALTTYGVDTPGYFVLGFVILMAAVAVAGNAIPAVGPALRSIGRYSYFMYFFHFWVLRWIEDLYRDRGWATETSTAFNLVLLAVIFVVTVVISWAVGLVSWNVLEKRILAWAHRKVPSPKH